MPRSRPRRDWSDALAKVAQEGRCRVCAAERPQVAHVLGRRHDRDGPDGTLLVAPEDVVPLCERCHRAYDARDLDLLPHLTRAEQARAAALAGLIGALRRTSGRRAA